MSILNSEVMHKWIKRNIHYNYFEFTAFDASCQLRQALGLFMLMLAYAGRNGGSLRAFPMEKAARRLGLDMKPALFAVANMARDKLLDGKRIFGWDKLIESGLIIDYRKPADSSERVRRMRERRKAEKEGALARLSPGADRLAEGQGGRGVSAKIVTAPAEGRASGKGAGMAAMDQVTDAELDAALAVYEEAVEARFNPEKRFELAMKAFEEVRARFADQRRKLKEMGEWMEARRPAGQEPWKKWNETLQVETLQADKPANATLQVETLQVETLQADKPANETLQIETLQAAKPGVNETLQIETLQVETLPAPMPPRARQAPVLPANACSRAAAGTGGGPALEPEIATFQIETLPAANKESRARMDGSGSSCFNINKFNININNIFKKQARQPGDEAAMNGRGTQRPAHSQPPRQNACIPCRQGQAPAGRGAGQTNAQAAARRGQANGAYLMASDGRRLTGPSLAAFERFWQAFALPRNKAKAVTAWLDIADMSPGLARHIIDAAGQEACGRDRIEARGGIAIQAPNWLNYRRWEDYEMRKAESRLPEGCEKISREQIIRNWNAQAVRHAEWLKRNGRALPDYIIERLAAQGIKPEQISV